MSENSSSKRWKKNCHFLSSSVARNSEIVIIFFNGHWSLFLRAVGQSMWCYQGVLEESTVRLEGGCLKHKLRLRISAPSCLRFPVSKPKAASSSPKQNDKHRRTNTEEMHRKQVVSLFILITIVTINCVINAIQHLCKQAVSDAVSYLQYEENNNNDVLTFSSSLIWFFQASSHCLNHRRPVYTENWFHNGPQTGFISVPRKPHISRKLPFSGREGGICRTLPLLTPHESTLFQVELETFSRCLCRLWDEIRLLTAHRKYT